jgi:hypothetical protein
LTTSPGSRVLITGKDGLPSSLPASDGRRRRRQLRPSGCQIGGRRGGTEEERRKETRPAAHSERAMIEATFSGTPESLGARSSRHPTSAVRVPPSDVEWSLQVRDVGPRQHTTSSMRPSRRDVIYGSSPMSRRTFPSSCRTHSRLPMLRRNIRSCHPWPLHLRSAACQTIHHDDHESPAPPSLPLSTGSKPPDAPRQHHSPCANGAKTLESIRPAPAEDERDERRVVSQSSELPQGEWGGVPCRRYRAVRHR